MVDGAGVLAAVLPGDHAAVPAGARGVGDARVHLDLQRLLLGGGAREPGRRPADHVVDPNLTGEFFSDDNLVAAASMLIALPTLIVYLALQKQFISGLTLGASKG